MVFVASVGFFFYPVVYLSIFSLLYVVFYLFVVFNDAASIWTFLIVGLWDN
jgi:hypothetical protein